MKKKSAIISLGLLVLSLSAFSADVVIPGNNPTGDEQSGKWFNEDLLRSMSLERPPVASLGGRYFAIIRQTHLNNWGFERTRQYMRLLKSIGITDIVQLNVRSAKVFYPSTNPDAIGARTYGEYDPLMMLVQTASEEGIKVWVKLQMASSGGLLPEKMQAHYPDGKVIKAAVGDPPAGDVPDFLSPDYREFLHQLIDEYATKYNKYGNFAGMFTDMLWNNYNDYHWKYMPTFDQFCMKNFGEHLPDDINKKMENGSKWYNPNDIWWRRTVLFKQWVNEDFHKDLGDYLHTKGFQLGIQIYDYTKNFPRCCTTINPYRWHLLADYTWDYPHRIDNELKAYPNNLAGFFAALKPGVLNAAGFSGQQGGIDFNFEYVHRPMSVGATPRIFQEYKRNIINVREWAGGTSLARITFLHNYNYLALCLGENAKTERLQTLDLIQTLARCQDVSTIFVEDAALYSKYRVLVATQYSVRGLSKENMDNLKKYITGGGIVISLNAQWSTSKPDISDETDISLEMSGAEFNKNGTGKISDGTIPVRENPIGKGMVVTIPVADFATAIQKDAAMANAFSTLIQKYTIPEITAAEKKEAKVRIVRTLKKNNWIGISLLSDDQAPASTTLSVDVEKLGVKSAVGYRVLLLGRGMELLKPGDFDGGAAGANWSPHGNFWTAKDLKGGFDVNILRDNDTDLKVPESRSVESLISKVPKYSIIRPGTIKRWLDETWSNSKGSRAYEHEIVVIAPANELTIEGK
ncbi:MAG: hypothetical protein WCV67_21310 [Victivallaceae bacterium]